ncbi:hypothetical protein JDV02_009255 [Purpureocillium takamizusanense]|uniref:Nephrocystin 3-like N-terminal domain-containing protein n=1 Tax=Purpureocillium takamizusanense TaxID=2060973 RepID=A0A9Q8QPK6_9HYPO|nr:uncharacterized protein JDV02_009255 [Purpureocillium takamizusanense]UNI23438.1 hypothetical protein JDV02_009255 [Purpureocillium takamizusanense]
MEALVAFGLACNVMQVINFAHEAVKVGKTIYETGSLDPDLAATTGSLTNSFEDLKTALEKAPKPLSKDDRELLDIAQTSLDTATALKAELDKIAELLPEGKAAAAFRAWLRAALGGKRRVEKLDKFMRSHQAVLETRLLVRLCTKADAILLQNDEHFSGLGTALQGFVQARARDQTSLDKLIRDESTSVKAHVSSQAAQLQRSTAQNIASESSRIREQIDSRLERMILVKSTKEEQQNLCDCLRYQDMNERRNLIKRPHEDTFEWIFRSDSHHSEATPFETPERRWDDFETWLSAQGNRPYWIRGKAGSGKSTLMKFLCENPQTRVILGDSQQAKIVISDFLWAFGQPLQKNIKGILCSLLHQLLLEVTGQAKSSKPSFSMHYRLSHVTYAFFSTTVRHRRRKIQDLTWLDIKKYTNDTLQNLFVNDDESLFDFTSSVCKKANGVFLWVFLALKSIRTGITNDDDINELERRLESLPNELHQLYQHMWQRLNETLDYVT